MARPAACGSWTPPARSRPSRASGAYRPLLLAAALLGIAAMAAWWTLPAFSAPPDASPGPRASAVAQAGRTSPIPSAPPSAAPATPGPSPSEPGRPPSASASGGAPRSPAHTPEPTPEPTTQPTPTRHPGAAPGDAADFERDGQVIEIGFPLKPSTRYRYRDNWGDLRAGSAEHYNHAHSRDGGELRRAHDGVDLYARRGEPVLAPFDGVVVRPADLWQPWHPERYGHTAVIVSREPVSEGYIALLSHLDRLWVEPDQLVRRGEVIGTVGSTGNAEGGRPHLHFELRAPFPLAWREVGRERLVDAFNPFPSLVAADPRRQD